MSLCKCADSPEHSLLVHTMKVDEGSDKKKTLSAWRLFQILGCKISCVCLFYQVTDVKFVPDSNLLVQTGEDKEVRYVLLEPSDGKISQV